MFLNSKKKPPNPLFELTAIKSCCIILQTVSTKKKIRKNVSNVLKIKNINYVIDLQLRNQLIDLQFHISG